MAGAETDLRGLVERYWRAEETRDVDAISAFYAPDARLVANGKVFEGVAAIATFYRASCEAFPHMAVTIVGGVVDGARGAFEWDTTVVAGDGQSYRFGGVDLFTAADGRFTEVRAFFDTATLPYPAG